MQHRESEKCKTWEEGIYWKHFHAMHFYQVLPHDFSDHLVLPSKFAENMLTKLPKKVSLIGPSGSSWDVEVSMTDKLALVGEGWKDFATTYNLEENYVLMFKYSQNLSFEVLIFDQKNLCEKECSYFIKKCSPKPCPRVVDRKRSVVEAASTEVLEVSDDGGGSDGVLSKKLKTCSVDQGHQNNLEAPRTTPSDDSSDDSSDYSSDDNEDEPELVLSDKTGDVAIEVVSSEGRNSHQGPKSCVSHEAAVQDGGISSEATNSKAQSAVLNTTVEKPSDNNTTWSWKLSQLNVIEQTRPENVEQTLPENGETEIYEAVVISPVNNSNVSSDAVAVVATEGDDAVTIVATNRDDAVTVLATNGDCPSTTNHSRRPVGKRSVRRVKRVYPKFATKQTSVKKLTFKSDTRRLSKEYMSHRRPVTDEEKEDALRRANKALTKGSFIVVMRPTGVYKRFYLNIPADWLNKNLARRHQNVILRVGETIWEAMFHYYGRKKGHTGGIATGWKNFAIDNNLEDSDVILFKPASQKGDATLILDVEIFRVVPEITPLTPLLCSM